MSEITKPELVKRGASRHRKVSNAVGFKNMWIPLRFLET